MSRDRALRYAPGGVAFAGIKTEHASVDGVDCFSRTRVGLTIGGGIAFAVTGNWSIRAEYRYADLGHIADATPFTFGFGSFVNHHETENAVRAGFSYKFDSFGAARY